MSLAVCQTSSIVVEAKDRASSMLIKSLSHWKAMSNDVGGHGLADDATTANADRLPITSLRWSYGFPGRY